MPTEFVVPADHASLPGHFPGRPIVPGVVLLDEVMACLPAGLALLSVKFTAPVLPGEVVRLDQTTHGDGRVGFAGTVRDRRVLHGVATPAA